MTERLKALRRRIVPARVRMGLRGRWHKLRPPRIEVGVGRGLRFDPGPSNVEYGVGSNEVPVQEALARWTGLGSTVFDIGANVGFFSVLAARLTGPGGRVVAFEPVDTNAGFIRRNAQLNDLDNISIIEKAVGATTGHAALTLTRYSGGAVLSDAGAPPDATGTITVEVVCIDDLLADGSVPVPDVVKIDVEGAELAVLQGMTQTLSEHRPIVLCEIDDATDLGATQKLTSCLALLESLGYVTSMLEDSYDGAEWVVRHFVGTPDNAESGT